MRGLDGEELLTAGEGLRGHSGSSGALALLRVAAPELPADELALLPLGTINAMLLELRAKTFGSTMEGFAVCPECGAQLEFAVDARDLMHGLEAVKDIERPNDFFMRPLNTADLLACRNACDEEEARRILLARTMDLDEVEGIEPAWLEQFDAMNAAAEIRVQLQCAACAGRPVLDFEIAQFFAREIGWAARRLLAEVHELASAYGWSEGSILSMSSTRRAAYLEMLSA